MSVVYHDIMAYYNLNTKILRSIKFLWPFETSELLRRTLNFDIEISKKILQIENWNTSICYNLSVEIQHCMKEHVP